jgi:hypothetical protein
MRADQEVGEFWNRKYEMKSSLKFELGSHNKIQIHPGSEMCSYTSKKGNVSYGIISKEKKKEKSWRNDDNKHSRI